MDKTTTAAFNDKGYCDCVNDILQHDEFKHLYSIRHHNKTSCAEHCIHVSYSCYLLLKGYARQNDVVRSALLHDMFSYDYHNKSMGKKYHSLHGLYHPAVAVQNATAIFNINKFQQDIIRYHMFPLTIHPPTSFAGFLVVWLDKYWAVREMFNIL